MDINELDRLIKGENTSGSNFTGADFVASYEAQKKNQEFLAGMKVYNQQKEREEFLKQQLEMQKKIKEAAEKEAKLKEKLSAAERKLKNYPATPNPFILVGEGRIVYSDAYNQAKKEYEQIAEELYGNTETRNNLLHTLQASKSSIDDEETKKRVDETIKELQISLYGTALLDEYLYSNINAGAYGFHSGVTKFLDATIGKGLNKLGFENNIINQINNKVTGEYERIAEYANNTALSIGDLQNTGGQIIQGIMGMLPDVIIALGTGFASKGASLTTGGLKSIANEGVKQTAKASTMKLVGNSVLKYGDDFYNTTQKAITSAAKNPLYWTSFTRTYGTDYFDAIESGATEEQAVVYATLTSTMNSLVEISGGVQVLPEKLKNLSRSQILDWVVSSLEEGGEEVIQSLISEMNEKVVYLSDKEAFSLTNREAIINPQRLWDEFKMGVTVSAIASGGQITANNIVTNDLQYSEIGKNAKKSNTNINDIVKYSLKSNNETVREIAINSVKRISNRDLGVLYSYVVQNIDSALLSTQNINQISEIATQIIEENNNDTFKQLVLSRYITRLSNMQADISEFEAAEALGVANNIDSAENSDYNNTVENANVGGGENAIHQQRGMEESGGEYRAIDSGRKGETRRTWQENEEAFTSRNERNQAETGRTKRILLKHGNAQMAYTSAEVVNDTSGGRAVQILHKIGINAEYADGDIETNAGNVTTAHTQAFTAPDGTVYVSSNATLSDIEIAAHESVHVNDVLGTEAYISYQAVIKDNIRWNSESYRILSKKINEAYNGRNKDVYSENFGAKFIREIAAYINQFAVTDLDFATQQFSDLFYDWNAVVEASRQFNKDIGADSNESASLMTKNSDLQSTADGKISKLSAAKPEYNPIEDLHYQSVGVERLTADQKKLKKVGQQFGAKVLFKDLDEMRIDPETGKEFLFSPEGQFDPETNSITLNTNVKEFHRPVEYILKHELTHSLEIDKDNYALFAVQVLRSDAFAEYVRSKGFESADAWAAEIIKQYSGKGVKSYQGPKAQLLANQEMIANFVGDMLFGGRTDITEKLLNNMAPAERSGFIAKIKEFFAKLKELFKGSEELTEIERLENLFLETANKVAAKNKTATQGSGDIVYSENGVPIIDLSKDNELSNEIGELTGADKYKVIRDYILKTLDKQPILLSDGKKAIVDKSDALHIANKAANKKTAQISKIKELVENAVLFAENKYVEHNKFDYFCYYRAQAKYNGEIIELFLNVGRDINGGRYHIYDITNKIRDTADRINGLERPKPNEGYALTNGVSINSISENGDTVNNNYAQSDKQYSFAVERDSSKIQKAEEREAELRADNKTDKEIREAIWKEFGIIRDTEGIWKYEINDLLGVESKIYPDGTALIQKDPDFEEYVNLIKKSNPTKKQKDRLAEISNKFKSKYDFGQLTLKHFIKHDELFAKYPQLKNVKIGFENLGAPYEASYNSAENKIVFDKRFAELDDTERAIVAIHEIQHAIQKIEGTEPGSSLEYWNARILKGERLPINPDTGKPYTAYEAYERTRGEIEAREAGGRVDMTKQDRKENVPNFGWENSISSRQRELVTALNSEYSFAVENGNLSKAQVMVDKVAQMFGYTERLYHQTNADFTEFNTNNQRAGKYDWELPTGTFLKPTDADIGLSGKKQMELYANIKNPLEFKNRYAAQKYWSENIPGYDKAAENVLNIDADYRAKVDAATDAIQQYSKRWRQNHPKENRRAIYSDAEYQRLSDKQADIIDAWEKKSNKASLEAKRLIDDYIANSEYDGIIVERDKDGENRETKSYIVFDSSQLKSAAPVTYDNSGNVVSLSKRFDENQSDIRYSIPEVNNSVENYTEEQYNNFGWVRYNDVLAPAEYNILLSRYADFKHNKDKYPITRFGEAVIHSTECPNVIMYAKGNIGNPHITKIVEIIADDNEDISVINERIIKNEYKQKPLPYQTITSMYGEEYLRFHRGKDYASFRQYRAEQKGINSQGGNSVSGKQQDRTGSSTESKAINIDRTNGLKYSIPSTVDIDSVIDAVERGQMSASEAKELLGRKILNPTEIANIPKEMADLTLIHGEPKRVGTGDEESKFYESALNSKIITDEVKAEIENDTYIKNYHSTTNKKTLRMAMRELEEGGYTRANQFLRLQAEKGSAVDVAIGLILLERYQRANKIDDALLVAEKLREIGTAAGQTVQMFSVLGRFTPEMMVEYSARELKKAYEKMVETKSQAWIDKNKTKFELTQEDIVFIKNNILFASNLEEGRQKAILLAEVCTRVQNKIPPESGQSIRAWQRISLLLNPKTNIRNILGNANMAGVYVASDFFGSLIDRQIAKKTGVRTTGNYHLKGSGTAIKKGLYESYDDFKRGIRTKQDELNRYDVNRGGGKSFNEQHKGPLAKQLNAVAKALNTLDNFTSFCLEAGDRPFFEMWFTNSLNNQMKLNNVDIPTPAMMEIARLEAEQRTWQDSNAVSRAMTQLKRSLNNAHLPGTSYGFGDFVLKFVKTPANIAKAMVEFSPIGLATAGSKAVNFKNALSRGKFDAAMQKEVVRSMSSAITGTLLYVLVAAGLALGTIDLSGGGDDDKDVSNFEKYVVGIPPYSMKIFGQNVTYSWNQPVGVILATVADFMESKEDGITAPWYEDLLGAFKTGTAVFTEQSFLSSLYELFSAEDLATGVFDAVLSEPSAFMPQFVSQIASFTDPYRRTTYHKGSAWRSAINGIIYKIPGLRKTLPEQVNILGETSKNTQYLNPWEAFISPGNTYPESSGAVAEEIYELYKLTGNSSVMPRTAPYSYTVKGEAVSLTPDERAEFQRVIGTESVRILNALFDSAEYKTLNDEQKSDAVKRVYDYAYDKAKSRREYKYDTVAAMSGGEKVLPKAKWDKLSKSSRLALVEDYFLTNEQLRCKGDAEKLAALFIKKSKE